MNYISLRSIQIAANRQRRTFTESSLRELSDGIEKRGLLHAIVIRKEADAFVLVAGERRIRAITDLAELGISISHGGEVVPLGMIPYTLFTDLDPLAAEEAELEENIHREDLTWQERAAACARLSSLRIRQAVASGDPLPTVADLALEVRGSSEGSSHETTRREIIVAQHLGNAEVAAAKTVNEAFKVLRRQEATERARGLGESVGRTYTAEVHRVLNLDAVDFLQECGDNQYDCILTDPPYGMGADTFGDSGGVAAGAHGYEDSEEVARRIYTALAIEGFRVTRPQAHLYAFCDLDKFPWLKETFVAAGWWVFRTPLIWYKRLGSRAPWPEHGPQRKYETILYAVKGKRPTLKLAGDVLEFSADENLGHAAQKPVALIRELLSRTCLPGQAVLDPCCGTGSIFPAAHELKLRATGIELDTASYGIAVRRLEELKVRGELPL